MTQKVVILDYGMGNLHSVYKKIYRMNVQVYVSSDIKDILDADKIILPGVGHFAKAMEQLKIRNFIEPLTESVKHAKKPILGICLGMQLFAKYSEEGNVPGLGWIDAEVCKFTPSNTLLFKIPHIGWNQALFKKESFLHKNIPHNSDFYFVHSYFMKCYNQNDILHETEYDGIFTSAIEKDTIFGVQYHPEKSHKLGEQLLHNFICL